MQAAHRGRFPVPLSVNGKPDDVAAYPDAERAALIDRAYAAEIDLAEVVDLLAAADRQVAMALAANDAVPSSSLQELVERSARAKENGEVKNLAQCFNVFCSNF